MKDKIGYFCGGHAASYSTTSALPYAITNLLCDAGFIADEREVRVYVPWTGGKKDFHGFTLDTQKLQQGAEEIHDWCVTENFAVALILDEANGRVYCRSRFAGKLEFSIAFRCDVCQLENGLISADWSASGFANDRKGKKRCCHSRPTTAHRFAVTAIAGSSNEDFSL
ncbi:unnamed protein product [Soboliphyme baturini]|uniref:Peptidase_S8 domain-containing protein n=1 Tax=Soboliphyme baturini TaxID=241478 RepID=A0A183IB18_9BILA|nr:unnamed protein product [Soboliphyme baturini]